MTVSLKTTPQTKPKTQKFKRPTVQNFFSNNGKESHENDVALGSVSQSNTVQQAGDEKDDEKESIYGWRTVLEEDEHGNKKAVRIPLTLEDYLHPQEGDDHMQNQSHHKIGKYIEAVLELYLRHIYGAVVFNDVGIKWPGFRHYAPDISVIFEVRNPERTPQKIFYVADEGTEPNLIIEVTSPTTRHVDWDERIDRYARVGVPYYYIVDTIGEHDDETPILQVHGFEWTPNGYVELTANEHGWFWMPPVEAWLGLDEGEVRCYDRDGHELPTPVGLAEQLDEASERLAETSQNLLEESVARVEADRRAEEEATARAEADRRAEQEATARAEANRRVKEADRRAEEADRRAEEEARIRREFEEQIRLLQAQLAGQK
ncbi:MAG: Uma2 family endonuclease [Chloroflexota bacterium]